MTRSRFGTLILWAAAAIGLGWAWQLPPVPRLVVRADAPLEQPRWSRDGRYVAAYDKQYESFNVWDADTGRFMAEFAPRLEGGHRLNSVGGDPPPFLPILVTSPTWSVLTQYKFLGEAVILQRLWRPAAGEWVECALPPEARVALTNLFSVSPDGRHMTFPTASYSLTLWDLEGGRRVLDFPTRECTSCTWTADGRLAVCRNNCHWTLYDPDDGRDTARYDGLFYGPLASSDGRWAVTWGGGNDRHLLELATRRVWPREIGRDAVPAFSPDGRYLALVTQECATAREAIHCFRLSDEGPTPVELPMPDVELPTRDGGLNCHFAARSDILCVDFSPDRTFDLPRFRLFWDLGDESPRLMAVADSTVWDGVNRPAPEYLNSDSKPGWTGSGWERPCESDAVCISPDGRRLGRLIKLMRRPGELERRLAAVLPGWASLWFGPEYRGELRLLDAATLREEGRWWSVGVGRDAYLTAFAPDARAVAVVIDGALHVYDLPLRYSRWWMAFGVMLGVLGIDAARRTLSGRRRA